MSAPGGEEAYRIDYDTYLFHNIEQTLEDYMPLILKTSVSWQGVNTVVCAVCKVDIILKYHADLLVYSLFTSAAEVMFLPLLVG